MPLSIRNFSTKNAGSAVRAQKLHQFCNPIRILVPAPIRRRINAEVHGKDFFLVIGENRRPWLYPNKFYEELAGTQRSELTPGPETAEFDRMNFGMAQF